MNPGVTATDLVLTITDMLRKHGVVGKFVEFYGDGVARVPLANRATIGNMSPEFGSTCAIFPIDEVTLDYLRLTGRSEEQIALVEAYAKEQGMWLDPSAEPRFSEKLELDLSTVVPSIAGPEAPAGPDRALSEAKQQLGIDVKNYGVDGLPGVGGPGRRTVGGEAAPTAPPVVTYGLKDGAVVIASITSCTNTSNPSVMMAAGLLAKKAVEKGLRASRGSRPRWHPGSQGRHRLLREAGLWPYLDKLGFNLVGYGCATCIGNSGPLPEEVRPRQRATSPSPRCCRATATSRAGSTRTSR
jgi:aconitate hydratase